MAPRVDKMFYYNGEQTKNGMPWWIGTSHDKGQATELTERPTWAEVRKYGGLDWDPTEEQLFREFDIVAMRKEFAKVIMDAEMPPELQLDALMLKMIQSQRPVEGWKHIGRSDDGDATLACTQESYRVL